MFLKRAVQQIPLQVMMVVLAGLLALLRLFVLAGDTPSAFGPFPQLYSRFAPLMSAFSLLLLAASALFLQVFMRQTRLTENRKYYPLMLLPLFLLLFVEASDWFALCLVLLLCGFFLPALFSVYAKESYRQNAGVVVGMLCGCMGTMDAPLLLLLLFYYGMLFAHRLANFRSLLLPLAGVGLWAGYAFFGCRLLRFPVGRLMQMWLSQWGDIGFRAPSGDWPQLAASAVLTLLYVVSTYRMIRSLYTKNILIRKKCILLFFLSLFFLLLHLFSPAGNLLPLGGFMVILVMILCEEEAYLRNRLFCNLCLAFCWVVDIRLLL
ncbi:MAG: hypothetical protein J6S82_10350 [Bacteroidales bacterium]|nr:hypothetical protein [Bacteroidales bacterium]